VYETAQPGEFSFECTSNVGERRWLDGDTVDNVVLLAPHTNKPFTGTYWRIEVLPELNTHITLECMGDIKTEWKYLYGHTAANQEKVTLAETTGAPFSGTHWELILIR
jgi:hypothetical protein